jgi:NAD(P)-dependent dehydrogenase (short-subunit alcohol dehydrogenase family)
VVGAGGGPGAGGYDEIVAAPDPAATRPSRRVVLVTGGSSGIGAATALLLARRGDTVITLSRDAKALEAAAESHPGIHPTPGDVLDADRIGEVAASTVAEHGRLDAVVHAAQVMAYGAIEDVPPEVFRQVVDTAIHGTANVARAVLPAFRRQRRGTLVVVNSLLGEIPTPQMGAYDVGKWGQRALAEVLRLETRDVPGVDVCMVSPGAINTPIYDQAATFAERRGYPPPPVLQPERVAREIVAVLERPRRNTNVGPLNTITVAGYRLLPAVYERLVGPLVKRLVFRGRPTAPAPGNVFEPTPEGEAVHGRWDALARVPG